MGSVFNGNECVFNARKGNIVHYRDDLIEHGVTRSAVVTGTGRKDGRKIVFLSDGRWTYHHNIRCIKSGKHDPEAYEKARVAAI